MDISETEKLGSSLVSGNITILGRRTSIRLEEEMWSCLQDVAKHEGCTIHNLASLIFIRKSRSTSLTSAIRVFLMLYYRAAATVQGHEKAGHGSFKEMKIRAKIKTNFDLKEKWHIGGAEIEEFVQKRTSLNSQHKSGSSI